MTLEIKSIHSPCTSVWSKKPDFSSNDRLMVTELEKQARAEGRLAADANLSKPFFYISAGVEESWLIERINKAVVVNPSVVHAAEEDSSVAERLYRRVLHQLGVPPPYWRFLPGFLRLWPVHQLRATRPFVGRPAGDINPPVDAGLPAK